MKSIEKSLITFLKNDTYKVAILKGEWGVGKTYFWNNFLNENTSILKKFRAYSYVSIFGIKDFSSINSQIFSSFKILDDSKLKKQTEKLKPLAKILKSVKIPGINSSKAISSIIESNLINNFLICIDDMERKEKDLSISSVLGLISALKEEKKCKIILIFNDVMLDAETKEGLNEYREKIVDIELSYNPTINENLAIIWPDKPKQNIQDLFQKLKLNNIRIMQKVRWIQEYFEDQIKSTYPYLYERFMEKAACLSIFYHAYSNDFNLDEIMDRSFAMYSLLDDDDEQKEKYKVLNDTNHFPENFDQVIVDYLLDGYVNIKKYEDILSKANEQYRVSDISSIYQELRKTFDSNFKVPQDVFITKSIEFLENHVKDLYLQEVIDLTNLIKKIDSSKNFDSILDKAIDIHVQRLEDRDIIYSSLPKRIADKLNKKIKEKTVKKIPITDLFNKLAIRDSWNPADIEFLSIYEKDDFYNWIIQEEDKVILLIHSFFERFDRPDKNKMTESVISKIKAALDDVKSRSNLDELRVNICNNYK
jgi:hypothetical protein